MHNHNNAVKKKKPATISLAIVLIPFIVMAILSIGFGVYHQKSSQAEYEYVSKNWEYTTVDVISVDKKVTRTKSRHNGHTRTKIHTTYIGYAKYEVDGKVYSLKSAVSGMDTKTIDIYYNPQNPSHYSTNTTPTDNVSLILISLFCIIVTIMVTVNILQLKLTIRIIYLIVV